MTRDEEIRHDLARQWQELEGKKTDQDTTMITQDIRDFLAIAKALGKKKHPGKQAPHRRLPGRATATVHTMNPTFGAIDTTQIIENEFRIGILEGILEWMVENNPDLVGPNQQTLDQIKRTVFEELAAKYPESGLIFNGREDTDSPTGTDLTGG